MTPRQASEGIFVGSVLRAQPDRRLVALAREGHRTAIDEIVRRYRPALLRYAASVVPPDRADDVVQESLARALPGIESGDSELHLRPWLYTIVRNTAFNDLRDAGPPCEHLDENYDGVEQPPQALERREQVRSLLAGLNGLPETQRQALVKREMEGRSHADIGAHLGISVGAARQLIYRARSALREGIGALVPMPLLRQLLDGSDASGAAGVAGGAAVTAKVTIAVLATSAAVTAGVAIKESHPQRTPAAPSAAKRVESLGAPTSADPGSGGNSRLTAFAGGAHGSTQVRAQLDGGGRLHVTAGVAKPTAGGGGNDSGSGHQGGRGAIGDVGTQGGPGHGEGGHQGGSQSSDSGSGDSSGGPDAGSGSPGGEQPANDGQDGPSETSGDSVNSTSSGGDGGSDGDAGTAGSHDGPGSGPSTLLLGSD